MSADPRDGPFEAMIRKLSRLRILGPEAESAIRALPCDIRKFGPGTYLVREGEQGPTHCQLLVAGYVYRSKATADGARQIVSLHMRGDMVDLQHFLLKRADHSVQALTACEIGAVPMEAIRDLITTHVSAAEALWLDSLVEASIFREWVLNVGRRDARSRIAHLLCEFGIRWEAAGLGQPSSFELPMTQEQLADATGMTSVHVNRVLQMLGADGLIARDRRRIIVCDWERLKTVADFSPEYLHQDNSGEHVVA